MKKRIFRGARKAKIFSFFWKISADLRSELNMTVDKKHPKTPTKKYPKNIAYVHITSSHDFYCTVVVLTPRNYYE